MLSVQGKVGFSNFQGAFPFSFVCVMYLNIASYLCEKHIKSKLGNKLYL